MWDYTLEKEESPARFAFRLGLRQIDGLREEMRQPSRRDASAPDRTISLSHNKKSTVSAIFGGGAGLPRRLERFAAPTPSARSGLDRRQALWEVRGLPKNFRCRCSTSRCSEIGDEPLVTLPIMPLSEHVVNDYRTLRLSLKAHPLSFLRDRIRAARFAACGDLKAMRDGAKVSVAGVVLVRQRPGSAAGVVFMTIEDETGIANSVIWPKVLERERKVVMGARLVVVHGRIQRHEDIIHVVAERLEDRSDWLSLLIEDGEPLTCRSPMPTRSSGRTQAHGARLKGADAVRSPPPTTSSGPLPAHERSHPRWHPRRHPRAERIVPKSRDFH